MAPSNALGEHARAREGEREEGEAASSTHRSPSSPKYDRSMPAPIENPTAKSSERGYFACKCARTDPTSHAHALHIRARAWREANGSHEIEIALRATARLTVGEVTVRRKLAAVPRLQQRSGLTSSPHLRGQARETYAQYGLGVPDAAVSGPARPSPRQSSAHT